MTIGLGAIVQGPPAPRSCAAIEVVGTAADADRGEAVPELAAGIAAFERGRWRDADRPFATVLASNPSDRPVRFYQSIPSGT